MSVTAVTARNNWQGVLWRSRSFKRRSSARHPSRSAKGLESYSIGLGAEAALSRLLKLAIAAALLAQP